MSYEHEHETHEDRVRERFERDVDFLRGEGQHPTTDDLRAFGEQLAYARMADNPPAPMAMFGDELDTLTMDIAVHFPLRNDVPELREGLRKSIRRLKEALHERGWRKERT